MTVSWTVDKSALTRLPVSPDADAWVERIRRRLVRVCTVTVLEVGYSARTSDHWERLVNGPPAAELVPTPLTPRMEARAVEVQGLLARLGMHRAPSVADLLIAAERLQLSPVD